MVFTNCFFYVTSKVIERECGEEKKSFAPLVSCFICSSLFAIHGENIKLKWTIDTMTSHLIILQILLSTRNRVVFWFDFLLMPQ